MNSSEVIIMQHAPLAATVALGALYRLGVDVAGDPEFAPLRAFAMAAGVIPTEPEPVRIPVNVTVTGYATPEQMARMHVAVDVAGDKPSYSAPAARELAKLQGYEGDACGSCGNFTLVRNGTCMKCNSCGETSGCS